MARRQLLRAINRATILNAIKAHGAIARTDIAAFTGLSPATVTSLTAELIEDGLIYEKTEGESRGGRRPILLALDTKNAVVTGVKLAEEHITLALTDLNADVLAQQTLPLEDPDPQLAVRQIAHGVRALLEAAGFRHNQLLGVGVGLSGIIDSEAGICHESPHNNWRDVAFAEMLANELDCIVYLDNNVNTLTLVEQLYGVGQQVRDFLVITVGRGIGLGIVTNGVLYRGGTGGAGEFGHTVVEPDGFMCHCGNRGCLETFVAEPWLIRRAHMNGVEVASPDELIAAAQNGNVAAQQVFERAGTLLGQAIANLVNVLNPSLVIISGEGVRAGDLLFAPMRAAIERHALPPLAGSLELHIEPISDDTWARGAASLVLGRIFSVPQLK
jgi:N-acetylglucosamine repressor